MFITALLCILPFLHFVWKDKLKPEGWYVLVFGILSVIFSLSTFQSARQLNYNSVIQPGYLSLNIKINNLLLTYFTNSMKHPVGIYLLKVNNRNNRTRCEISSKLTIKKPERRQWFRSGIFIVNFEDI